MISKQRENEVVKMFCAYCRRSLFNARTDIMRRRAHRRSREKLFCEMSDQEVNNLSSPLPFSLDETVFDVGGKHIGVNDPDLAEALEALSSEARAIVLLSFFAGWSDRRIGAELGLPRSTVQWKKTRALQDMRRCLEEKGVDDDDFL